MNGYKKCLLSFRIFEFSIVTQIDFSLWSFGNMTVCRLSVQSEEVFLRQFDFLTGLDLLTNRLNLWISPRLPWPSDRTWPRLKGHNLSGHFLCLALRSWYFRVSWEFTYTNKTRVWHDWPTDQRNPQHWRLTQFHWSELRLWFFKVVFSPFIL